MAHNTRTLRTVVFIGSARDVIPPWGGDYRLGDRVVKHVLSTLSTRKTALGDDEVSSDTEPLRERAPDTEAALASAKSEYLRGCRDCEILGTYAKSVIY